jgi:hypothetical protein
MCYMNSSARLLVSPFVRSLILAINPSSVTFVEIWFCHRYLVELIPLLSISSSEGVRDLTFVESVKFDFETDQASYSVGKTGPYPRVKQPGSVAALSPPYVVQFTKTGAILLLPTYAFMPCA